MLPLLAAAALTIDAHRRHDRLLVVFAPDAASPALAAQRAEVDGAAFAERDLRLVEVVGAAVTGAADPAATLRARFHVASGAFRAVLVGKDGGVKLDSATPLAAARLAATIDAMPMRRDEMRRH
jgi:hypothetical protein